MIGTSRPRRYDVFFQTGQVSLRSTDIMRSAYSVYSAASSSVEVPMRCLWWEHDQESLLQEMLATYNSNCEEQNRRDEDSCTHARTGVRAGKHAHAQASMHACARAKHAARTGARATCTQRNTRAHVRGSPQVRTHPCTRPPVCAVVNERQFRFM